MDHISNYDYILVDIVEYIGRVQRHVTANFVLNFGAAQSEVRICDPDDRTKKHR